MIHRFTYACLFVLVLPSWALAQEEAHSSESVRPDSGEAGVATPPLAELPAVELSVGLPAQAAADSNDPPKPTSEVRDSAEKRDTHGLADDSEIMTAQNAETDRLPEQREWGESPEPGSRTDFIGPNPKQASSSLRQQLAEILTGRASELWPKDGLTVNVPSQNIVGQPQGSYALVAAQPKTLTMDQRREIYLSRNLAEIRDDQKRLSNAENESEKEKILASLMSEYSARFEIDTVFQELKLEEIERRASILRAEVQKRSESQAEWVNAMVTLDKMRANGIDTMPSNSPTNSAFTTNSAFNGLAPNRPAPNKQPASTGPRFHQRTLGTPYGGDSFASPNGLHQNLRRSGEAIGTNTNNSQRPTPSFDRNFSNDIPGVLPMQPTRSSRAP